MCGSLSYCTETLSSWTHWVCMAGVSFVHPVGAAPLGVEDTTVASSCLSGKMRHLFYKCRELSTSPGSSTVLPQESWLHLRNALSPLSSSQKNSSSFWKKAHREMKSSKHQVAVTDSTGVSCFMSGGVWRREAGKACYPRSSETRTGEVCWGRRAAGSEAQQSLLSQTGSSWPDVWMLCQPASCVKCCWVKPESFLLAGADCCI